MTERLHPSDVDAIARRIAELLADITPPRPRLVDATELAALLGVTRTYVYDHADELGAIRLGDGTRGRLRFDVDTARAALTSAPAPVTPQRATTRRARPTAGHVLKTRRAA